MGFFGCDHEWDYHTNRTVWGWALIGGSYIKAIISQHKCTKCGKVEDCDENGEKIYCSLDADMYHCSKCRTRVK